MPLRSCVSFGISKTKFTEQSLLLCLCWFSAKLCILTVYLFKTVFIYFCCFSCWWWFCVHGLCVLSFNFLSYNVLSSSYQIMSWYWRKRSGWRDPACKFLTNVSLKWLVLSLFFIRRTYIISLDRCSHFENSLHKNT